MTIEEIIQVCDLYAQGINELSKLTSQEGYSKEVSELLNASLKSKEDGFNCTHDWIKQYVLNNSQIDLNGKELLYVAQKTAERTKKELINKACEWIEKNKHLHKVLSFKSLITDWDKFIREFRKAMEE